MSSQWWYVHLRSRTVTIVMGPTMVCSTGPRTTLEWNLGYRGAGAAVGGGVLARVGGGVREGMRTRWLPLLPTPGVEDMVVLGCVCEREGVRERR